MSSWVVLQLLRGPYLKSAQGLFDMGPRLGKENNGFTAALSSTKWNFLRGHDP
jgi:hypothetical protein